MPRSQTQMALYGRGQNRNLWNLKASLQDTERSLPERTVYPPYGKERKT